MEKDQVTVVAQMKAKPGKEDRLKNVLLGLIEPTHQEVGCIDYTLHESPSEPGSFMFFENWTSQAALDQHLETPHLKVLKSLAPEMIEGEIHLSLWGQISTAKQKV